MRQRDREIPATELQDLNEAATRVSSRRLVYTQPVVPPSSDPTRHCDSVSLAGIHGQKQLRSIEIVVLAFVLVLTYYQQAKG